MYFSDHVAVFVGRIMRLARPFICLSVRLFFSVRAFNSKSKGRRQTKIAMNISQG